MAYSYTWPAGLPQTVQKGYSESSGVLILRTPMDAGPAKMRKRGNKPQVLSVNFLMTTNQVEILDSFIKDTLQGTARFGFTHPRTGNVVEVRIIPSNDGNLFNISYTAPDYYNITLSLEVLP